MLCRNGLGIGCLIFFGWDVLTFQVFFGERTHFFGGCGVCHIFFGVLRVWVYIGCLGGVGSLGVVDYTPKNDK